MKSETPEKVWKRFWIVGILLLFVLWILDRATYRAQVEEEKNLTVLETLEKNKVLSDELYVLFHGVQDDFFFFEKEILTIMKLDSQSLQYRAGAQSLIKFLETHTGYFKVRLTNSRGQELFKIVEDDSGKFQQSTDLYLLSEQPFYQDLNSVRGKDFFFSSMEPLIINGVMVKPVRPTVRISRRITLNNGEDGLLIFNIDGERIYELFSRDRFKNKNDEKSEKALLDDAGNYIASFPFLDKEQYIFKKKILNVLPPEVFLDIKSRQDLQGTVMLGHSLLIYSKILLPNTNENWFLVTKLPESAWENIVYRKRLKWIFWGLLCFFILMFWYWKHEKKRYKDEVVEVLLKERNEFIQNVSHQLKTPLAILHSSLNKHETSSLDKDEIRKEILHLNKVVDDMLLLALVDANPKIPMKKEDILEIVSDSIVTVGPKSKEKDVTIRLNVDEKLYNSTAALERFVMSDLLKSALINLLDNAIDFSPREGTVDIFLTTLGNHVKIQVKDHGPGISEEMLPHLFKRFTRGKESFRKGTGLGLSICKKIIELHHGEIELIEHKNGATFQITL